MLRKNSEKLPEQVKTGSDQAVFNAVVKLRDTPQCVICRHRFWAAGNRKELYFGVVLLTERSIRVGDLVSVSGIEGDINKINVRATKVQLSDRSVVIVPNFHFISQNLRNVTQDNSKGVVTISLNYPYDTNIDAIGRLVLEIYNNNDFIQKKQNL